MIIFNAEYVGKYILKLLEDKLEYYYEIDIGDVDDLHDFTIESEDISQIDLVYGQLCSVLPLVFDEAVDLVGEFQEEDVWGTLAMRESIGLCD